SSGFLRRFLRGRFLLRDLLAWLAHSDLDRLLAGQRLRPIGRGGAQLKRLVPGRQRLVEHDAPGTLLIGLGLGDLGSAALQGDGPARLGAAGNDALARRLDADDVEARHGSGLGGRRLGLLRLSRLWLLSRLLASRHLVLDPRGGTVMAVEVNACPSEGDYTDHCYQ